MRAVAYRQWEKRRGTGSDHADCVVALCWLHHRAYDTGRLELLPYLEPRWRVEIAHAVVHLGLIGAMRRLAPPDH
jgi:hypothetical protein